MKIQSISKIKLNNFGLEGAEIVCKVKDKKSGGGTFTTDAKLLPRFPFPKNVQKGFQKMRCFVIDMLVKDSRDWISYEEYDFEDVGNIPEHVVEMFNQIMITEVKRNELIFSIKGIFSDDDIQKSFELKGIDESNYDLFNNLNSVYCSIEENVSDLMGNIEKYEKAIDKETALEFVLARAVNDEQRNKINEMTEAEVIKVMVDFLEQHNYLSFEVEQKVE